MNTPAVSPNSMREARPSEAQPERARLGRSNVRKPDALQQIQASLDRRPSARHDENGRIKLTADESGSLR